VFNDELAMKAYSIRRSSFRLFNRPCRPSSIVNQYEHVQHLWLGILLCSLLKVSRTQSKWISMATDKPGTNSRSLTPFGNFLCVDGLRWTPCVCSCLFFLNSPSPWLLNEFALTLHHWFQMIKAQWLVDYVNPLCSARAREDRVRETLL
jgi:hypothetical protein